MRGLTFACLASLARCVCALSRGPKPLVLSCELGGNNVQRCEEQSLEGTGQDITSGDNLVTSLMSRPLACSMVHPGGTNEGGVSGLAVADDKALLSF